MKKFDTIFQFKMLVLIGLLLLLQFSQASADIVWQEDFENPPFDDWTLGGYKVSGDLVYLTNQTPRIENGRLYTGNINYWPNGTGAYHDSTVAYGTWSFDWIVPSELENQQNVGDHIFLISNLPIYLNGSEMTPPTLNGYVIGMAVSFELIATNPGTFFTFGEINYGIYREMGEYTDPNPFTGVLHIDITRDNDGWFRVYLNSSCEPVIEEENNRYKKS